MFCLFVYIWRKNYCHYHKSQIIQFIFDTLKSCNESSNIISHTLFSKHAEANVAVKRFKIKTGERLINLLQNTSHKLKYFIACLKHQASFLKKKIKFRWAAGIELNYCASQGRQEFEQYQQSCTSAPFAEKLAWERGRARARWGHVWYAEKIILSCGQ